MEVLCIKENWVSDCASGDVSTFPKIGDFCEVLYSIFKYGKEFYVLESYPAAIGFLAKHFSIISKIDETEMERNFNKKTA